MTNTALVSIIIPTYNRSIVWNTTCGSLINNILKQTYPNFEAIIVNDGSTDDTAAVLDEIAAKDSRIRVVNKENVGASAARNTGISLARGQYLFFIDDDDIVPTDYIESFMIEEYNGTDLIIDSYSNQVDDMPPKAVDFPEKQLLSKNSIIQFIFGEMQKRPYCFFPFAKRFTTSVIRNNKIRFDPSFSLGEDRPFVLDYIGNINTCRIINNHKYIAKSRTETTYRMSQGLKPVKELWSNFKNGYFYLKKYEESHSVSAIGAYADNYIVSKSIEYILLRASAGHYKNQESQMKEVFNELQKMPIDQNNIKEKKMKTIYWVLVHGGLSSVTIMMRWRKYITKTSRH